MWTNFDVKATEWMNFELKMTAVGKSELKKAIIASPNGKSDLKPKISQVDESWTNILS